MTINKYYYKSLADLIPMIEKFENDNSELTEKLKDTHDQLKLQGRALRKTRKDNERYRKSITDLRFQLGLPIDPNYEVE